MAIAQPESKLDERFSSPGAEPASWGDAEKVLTDAGVYWLSSVRQSGGPHVTPVAGVWRDGALYFSTGPAEQKALNLARNSRCAITVGQPDFWSGLDVVLEGTVERVADASTLSQLASDFERKYDGFFGFTADEGYFRNGGGGIALVYRVNASKGFGFTRGEVFSQTRWTLTDRR